MLIIVVEAHTSDSILIDAGKDLIILEDARIC